MQARVAAAAAARQLVYKLRRSAARRFSIARSSDDTAGPSASLPEPPAGTRIVFSKPSTHVTDDLEDYYRVYRAWCQDLEDDLVSVVQAHLGLQLSGAQALVRKLSDTALTIFLSPGKLRSRLQNFKQLEADVPGLSIAALLVRNPIIASHSSQGLRRKCLALQSVLGSSHVVARAVTKCPSLLTRSPRAIRDMRDRLETLVGPLEAAKVVARYPEVFSRSFATLEAAHAELLACWEGDAVAVRKLVMHNPALLTRKRVYARLVVIADAAGLGVKEARAVVLSTPVVLNLSKDLIRRKCRMLRKALSTWSKTIRDYSASTLGRWLTCSPHTLSRLQYVVSLRLHAHHRPSTLLMMKADAFDALFPEFEEWAAAAAARAAIPTLQCSVGPEPLQPPDSVVT